MQHQFPSEGMEKIVQGKYGIPLSILDLSLVDAGSTGPQALQNTIDLARHADQLGYTRYWLAEHHNMSGSISSTPELLMASVAHETRRIRVGSGGIMLPNHVPLKVVETFHMLEALYPGRIDLGIGRAPGTDQVTARALRGSKEALTADDFPDQLTELLAFSTGQFPDGHPFQSVRAIPDDVELPPLWLLGSSNYSSQLAARLGLGFAFAHHINPMDTVQIIRAYRENFAPSIALKQPRTILTVAIVCAETAERAEQLASSVDLAWLRLRKGRPQPLVCPEEAIVYPYSPPERAQIRSNRARLLIGTPSMVKAQLDKLIEQTRADEVMMTTNIYGHEQRVQSYELLAEAFDLCI